MAEGELEGLSIVEAAHGGFLTVELASASTSR